MAFAYKEQRKEKNEELTGHLMYEMPMLVKSFIQYVQDSKSDTTALSYARDIRQFIEFLCRINPECKRVGSALIDLDTFESLTIEDINEYSRWLRKDENLSPTTVKRRLSTIASFYRFLGTHWGVNNNPMVKYEYPKAIEHDILYLSSAQTKQLLSGILSNTMYLAPKKEKLVGIDEEITIQVPTEAPLHIRQNRERGLSRNYAIAMLLLGTGLRISELVGIDVADLDFENFCVAVSRKGHGESIDHVYFGDEVADALQTYLYGSPAPAEITNKYDDEVLTFCQQNCAHCDLIEDAKKKFGRDDKTFEYDISVIAAAERNRGRSGLVRRDKKTRRIIDDGALFISSRGRRMSVRMIEMIIKEAVLCYLPDMPDKDKISPHKLRSTCATRLLTQTDNILLVSKQLGHASPTVTAKHYAQLEDKKKREQAAQLKVTEW